MRLAERVIGGRGDDAVLESVAGFEAEDADGFDADVLIGGSVADSEIGSVGDGAGEDVDRAAAGVRDADEWDLDLLEGAVKVEIEMGELAHAKFVVDFDEGVDFLAAVAVGFKAIWSFEEFDFGRKFGRRFNCGLFLGFLAPGVFSAGFWRCVLRWSRRCRGAQEQKWMRR